MRPVLFVAIALNLTPLALLGPVTAMARQATPSASADAKPAFSTAATPLGVLLDNADTKAVLDKHIPQLINNDQISQARGLTLKGLQAYAGEVLTDTVLAEIDADLAKVPVKK